MTTFVPNWIAAKEDYPSWKRILSTLIEAAKTEDKIDSSWWTEEKLKTKMKKLAKNARGES